MAVIKATCRNSLEHLQVPINFETSLDNVTVLVIKTQADEPDYMYRINECPIDHKVETAVTSMKNADLLIACGVQVEYIKITEDPVSYVVGNLGETDVQAFSDTLQHMDHEELHTTFEREFGDV